MRAKTLYRSWPQWAGTDFVAFAMQSDLIGRVQAQVLLAQIEDLLHSSTGVEHQCEERIVAAALNRAAIDTLKERVEFLALEILDRRLSLAALKGNGQDGLELRQGIGPLLNKKASQSVQRRQARITSTHAVVSLALEQLQETLYPLGCQFSKSKGFDTPTCIARREPQP